MAQGDVGVAIQAPDALTALANIHRAEEAGINSAWMTSGGNAGDPLTLFAIAASQTSTISVGTSIMQIWSRHPVTVARQLQTMANVAPGRVKLGIGTGHMQGMQEAYGVDFKAPLGHLREYLKIVRTLLQTGSVDFQGDYYSAKFQFDAPVEVPVLASALRPASFKVCGEDSDGAISWVCPLTYLRDTALPVLKKASEECGRAEQPLVVHVPICVTNDIEAAREGVRRQLGYFPTTPFYAKMFEAAGFPHSMESGWTDDMIDAVMIAGDEETVQQRIHEAFDWGASEILASVIPAGDDALASESRTLNLLAQAQLR